VGCLPLIEQVGEDTGNDHQCGEQAAQAFSKQAAAVNDRLSAEITHRGHLTSASAAMNQAAEDALQEDINEREHTESGLFKNSLDTIAESLALKN
jgi:hypothetical protein